ELGDPDRPEDWTFMAGMSPYHVAEPGRPYPPVLIWNVRRAENNPPGSGRKVAAKFPEMGYQAHYYETVADGDGLRRSNAEGAGKVALGYRFLRDAIGWDA